MPDATRSQQPSPQGAPSPPLLHSHRAILCTSRSYDSSVSTACGPAEPFFPAEPKIESFLTDLTVNGNVAAATQNQAMNALVFLYKRVLNHTLEGRINGVRADKKINVPVVMTRLSSPVATSYR